VAPGSAPTIELRYELPPPVSPDRIRSLRLRWGLVQPGGERCLQFTELRRKPVTAVTAAYVVYDPVFGLYDPFFYPPPLVVHRERVVPVGVVVVHARSTAGTTMKHSTSPVSMTAWDCGLRDCADDARCAKARVPREHRCSQSVALVSPRVPFILHGRPFGGTHDNRKEKR
jgi:hypothetical protein